jgi:tetratricopeptide (TPR) repeat protein
MFTQSSIFDQSRYWFIVLLIIGTGNLATINSAHGENAEDNFWQFSTESGSAAEVAMTPQADDVAFIINNRPATVHPPTKHREIKKLKELETKLKQALDIARTHQAEEPKQLASCLENLGAYYYKQGLFTDSLKYLNEALETRQSCNGDHSLEVATTQDILGHVYRIDHQYEKAIALYRNSADIRRKLLGPNHKQVAASLMHVACAYYDNLDTVHGKQYESQAYSIIRKTGATSRQIPVSIFAPPRNALRPLLLASENIIDQENIEAARKLAEQQALADALAQLRAMNEKVCTIYGTMQVPIDRVELKSINKSISGEKAETHTESKIKDEAKVNDVKEVQIALCRESVEPRMIEAIHKFAGKFGLKTENFIGKWPGIKAQARDLLLEINRVVSQDAVTIVETDKGGEFQIKNVPEGKYYLYAYLLADEEAMFWLLPVTVKGKESVRLDFLADNITAPLWRKNKVAPVNTAMQTSKL